MELLGPPLAGLAGLALVAIAGLYFLKARRRPHVVASTLWWQPVTLDRHAAVPWQRLRPSWLLALQLLGAALVVGALLQPGLATARALTGQTIVIIDASETMQATDVAPSRFGRAVADARVLVAQLGSHARMTLVAMGPRPAVLAASLGQRRPLLAALSHLRPSAGPADLQDALQLAVAAAGPHASATQLVVLSDGITDPLPEPLTLPFPVVYRHIGVSEENVGVAALTVVAGLTGPSAVARIQDFGLVGANLTVELAADGRLVDAKAASIPGHGARDVSFAVPPGTASVRVSVVPNDELAADDTASAVVAAPHPVTVLLVSPGDVFLRDALALRPDVRLVTEPPSAWRPAQARSSSIGLYVFDGFLPAQLPKNSPYLLVAPPPNAAVGSGPPLGPGALLPAESDDPLLYDVDLSNVHVALSSDLRASHFGRAVITSARGPVLMVRDAAPGQPPAAVLGVYPHASDFVLRDAWPVLISHLSEFLAPPSVPAPSQVPGSTVALAPGPAASEVLVTRPDGHTDRLTAAGPGGAFDYTATSELGVYRVTAVPRHGARQVSYFAVNAPAEPTGPQEAIPVTGAPEREVPTAPVLHDWWPVLAMAALSVLLVEWAVYRRGN